MQFVSLLFGVSCVNASNKISSIREVKLAKTNCGVWFAVINLVFIENCERDRLVPKTGWFFVVSRQSWFRLWFLVIHFLCFMKITFSPGIFSIWGQLVKCIKNSFHFMKMTYYRLMCGYESLWVPCSIIWFVHKHLAMSYESAKYWLIQCYKCTIHCRAWFNLVALKPMKILLRKVHYTKLLGLSVTEHWSQNNSIRCMRPFFCEKWGESACGTFILFTQVKRVTVNQESLLRVYCMTCVTCIVWLISFGREMNNWKHDLFFDVVS